MHVSFHITGGKRRSTKAGVE